MSFRAFGIPTHIQGGFWFMALLLGYFGRMLEGGRLYRLPIWVAVVFVSIMVHELGHAFAMQRHGIQPQIILHQMGGLTSAREAGMLSRPQRMFISFAGPLAGFALGLMLYLGTRLAPETLLLRDGMSHGEFVWRWTVIQLLWVNIGWGLINLLPVLPLDGGHILEDLLGPQRVKLTTILSLIFGVGIVLLCLHKHERYLALMFGFLTFQNVKRYHQIGQARSFAPVNTGKPAAKKDAIPQELRVELTKAREALEDERFEQAGTIAELIVSKEPPKQAKLAALDILAWVHLMLDRPEQAARAVTAIERLGDADLALLGAVKLAQGDSATARKIFERARGDGDDRKNIVGPLIQLLLQEGEVSRAAAIALDVLESLSTEDARQMAALAFDGEVYGWAARLSEEVFVRSQLAADAYQAARARSLEGESRLALTFLRKAVAAGYSDAEQVWSDEALEALRNTDDRAELEAIVPRP